MPEQPTSGEQEIPRFSPNLVHLANGPFDVTMTWLVHDPTILPEDQLGPHAPSIRAVAQTVLSYGAAKSLIPILVRAVAMYEQNFGEVPSPGFGELSKE